MSDLAMLAAARLRKHPLFAAYPRAMNLLLSLADNADDDGLVWLPADRLVVDSGLSRPTLFRLLDLLDEAGIVSKVLAADQPAHVRADASPAALEYPRLHTPHRLRWG